MNVLNIATSYYPAFKQGGPIESIHLLNIALVKKGVNVLVLTTTRGLDSQGKNLINELHTFDGVKVRYLPFYFHYNFGFSLQLGFKLFKEIKNIDLIHLNGMWNFPALIGSVGSIIHNKPYIFSPRGNLYSEAILLKSTYSKKLYFYLIAKHILNKAGLIHFTTEDEKDGIDQSMSFNSKSCVISNGIDLNKFSKLPLKGTFSRKYSILKNKKYILYLGRLVKQKGLDVLLESFKELVKSESDLILVIAGPDLVGYKNELLDWLRKNSLVEKVLFTGLLTGDDKHSAYVDASVFVMPSYFESFGMAAIEAMACNAPVVMSTRVGICKSVKEYNAGIVVNNDPMSICKAVKDILWSENLKHNIIDGGQRLIREKYNIDVVADEMISAYESLLKSR